MKQICCGLLSLSFLATTQNTFAQALIEESSSKPKISLSVRIPSLIRPQSKYFLEVKLTNISNQDLSYSGWCPVWSTYVFDLRDASGAPVQKTEIGENGACRHLDIVTYSPPPTIISPGQSITDEIMLDRLFFLIKPGEYTASVSANYSTYKDPGVPANSNSVHFVVPPEQVKADEPAPSFSISIEPDRQAIQSGWDMPVKIAIKNPTKQNLRLFVPRRSINALQDEFGTGIVLFKTDGATRSQIQFKDLDLGNGHYPGVSMDVEEIAPGETFEQTRMIGYGYDIVGTAHYIAKVVLLDPLTNRLVESNETVFDVLDEAKSSGHEKKENALPFVVGLEPDPPEFHRSGRNLMDYCIYNITNQDVELSGFTTLAESYTVIDSDGRPAAPTEAGRNMQKSLLERLQQAPLPANRRTTWPLYRRSTFCQSVQLGSLFDLSAPGNYQARVNLYVKSDSLDSVNPEGIQQIHSSRIKFTVPAQGGSK